MTNSDSAALQGAATTDDSEIIEAGDEGEILNGDSDDRPSDCSCWDADAELPCFQCFREGFDTPNPAEPGTDDDEPGKEG